MTDRDQFSKYWADPANWDQTDDHLVGPYEREYRRWMRLNKPTPEREFWAGLLLAVVGGLFLWGLVLAVWWLV